MLEVDKKTFEDEVLKAEGYVFVDFFGDEVWQEVSSPMKLVWVLHHTHMQ